MSFPFFDVGIFVPARQRDTYLLAKVVELFNHVVSNYHYAEIEKMRGMYNPFHPEFDSDYFIDFLGSAGFIGNTFSPEDRDLFLSFMIDKFSGAPLNPIMSTYVPEIVSTTYGILYNTITVTQNYVSGTPVKVYSIVGDLPKGLSKDLVYYVNNITLTTDTSIKIELSNSIENLNNGVSVFLDNIPFSTIVINTLDLASFFDSYTYDWKSLNNPTDISTGAWDLIYRYLKIIGIEHCFFSENNKTDFRKWLLANWVNFTKEEVSFSEVSNNEEVVAGILSMGYTLDNIEEVNTYLGRYWKKIVPDLIIDWLIISGVLQDYIASTQRRALAVTLSNMYETKGLRSSITSVLALLGNPYEILEYKDVKLRHENGDPLWVDLIPQCSIALQVNITDKPLMHTNDLRIQELLEKMLWVCARLDQIKWYIDWTEQTNLANIGDLELLQDTELKLCSRYNFNNEYSLCDYERPIFESSDPEYAKELVHFYEGSDSDGYHFPSGTNPNLLLWRFVSSADPDGCCSDYWNGMQDKRITSTEVDTSVANLGFGDYSIAGTPVEGFTQLQDTDITLGSVSFGGVGYGGILSSQIINPRKNNYRVLFLGTEFVFIRIEDTGSDNLPVGILAATTYYVIRISSNLIQLAETLEDATDDPPVPIDIITIHDAVSMDLMSTYQEEILDTETDVNISTDIITVSQDFMTGSPVEFSILEGAILPTGILKNTIYYLIRESSTSVKIASSFDDANNDISIDIESTGTGNIYLNILNATVDCITGIDTVTDEIIISIEFPTGYSVIPITAYNLDLDAYVKPPYPPLFPGEGETSVGDDLMGLGDLGGVARTHKTIPPNTPIYTLTYVAGINGSISGISVQSVIYGGIGYIVEAVPDTDYHFVSWDDGLLTAIRRDVEIKSNLTVTASFEADV